MISKNFTRSFFNQFHKNFNLDLFPTYSRRYFFMTESLIPVKMKFHPATRRIRIDRFDGLQCLCAFNKSAKLWRAKTRGGEWYTWKIVGLGNRLGEYPVFYNSSSLILQ